MFRHSLLFAVFLLSACSEDDPRETAPGDTGAAMTDTLEAGPPASCPPPTGAPIEHSGNVTKDETWAAGIHHIKFTVGVRQDATLTIAPCAVVRVAPNYGIVVGTSNVGDGGTLIAKGTKDLPIVIERLNEGTAWADVLIFPKGKADLAYTTIRGGGGAASRGAANLHLYGDSALPLQTLARVDHVTIDGSVKYGVVTEGHAGFDPSSDALVVRGAAEVARMTAPALGTMPPGTYTGNTLDAIRISGTQAGELLEADTTIKDRGVPYIVGGDGRFGELSVVGKSGTEPVLTIEAGVTLKFIAKGGLFVERASGGFPAKGALVVKGTAEKPVVFTSAEATPAAGDWLGLWFGGNPSSKNNIDRARVEYAGGVTGSLNGSCGTPVRTDNNRNEAAIMIVGPPPTAFVTNTTIFKSAANGFERAWRGPVVSFLPTNTFTDVAYCQETYPKDDLGACPMTVPCPR